MFLVILASVFKQYMFEHLWCFKLVYERVIILKSNFHMCIWIEETINLFITVKTL